MMTKRDLNERDVRILMEAGFTRSFVEWSLLHGTVIYEADDFEKNLETYLCDWCAEEEERELYREMFRTHEPI